MFLQQARDEAMDDEEVESIMDDCEEIKCPGKFAQRFYYEHNFRKIYQLNCFVWMEFQKA